MISCPYYDSRGFCAKPVMISINESGMCDVIWKDGHLKTLVSPFTDETLYRKELINLVVLENNKNKKGDAETRLEDPQDGDAVNE